MQDARSFGLLAALKLAKVYQSTARPVDAHDILAPALEGFSPTPEMPEIAEGQALLAALVETDRVKVAAASRERRLKLQTSYSQAMAWSKGYANEETKAVLAQTERLAALSDNAAERIKTHHLRWTALFMGGELWVRPTRRPKASSARRNWRATPPRPRTPSGLWDRLCLYRGRFVEAGEHLREALRVYDPGREASVRRLHGTDAGITAKANLAAVACYVGDATGAAAQFEEASAEALASADPPTIAITYTFRAAHEMVRGDGEATTGAGNVLLDVAEKNGLGLYENLARMFLDWTRARLGVADGLARFRDHRETTINQGARLSAPLFHGRLAELEADQMSLDEALTSIDRAIELARAGDIRYIDALLHRIRGDILLPSSIPTNPDPSRRSLPRRPRRRAAAGRAQLRPAGGAEAGEALPIHRPPRRSPRGRPRRRSKGSRRCRRCPK